MLHQETTKSKITLRVLMTILTLVSWAGLPLFLKLLIVGYSAFKFFKLSSGGFKCTHCWRGWFLTLPAILLAFIKLPIGVYIVTLIFIWYDVLLPNSLSFDNKARY